MIRDQIIAYGVQTPQMFGDQSTFLINRQLLNPKEAHNTLHSISAKETETTIEHYMLVHVPFATLHFCFFLFGSK